MRAHALDGQPPEQPADVAVASPPEARVGVLGGPALAVGRAPAGVGHESASPRHHDRCRDGCRDQRDDCLCRRRDVHRHPLRDKRCDRGGRGAGTRPGQVTTTRRTGLSLRRINSPCGAPPAPASVPPASSSSCRWPGRPGVPGRPTRRRPGARRPPCRAGRADPARPGERQQPGWASTASAPAQRPGRSGATGAVVLSPSGSLRRGGAVALSRSGAPRSPQLTRRSTAGSPGGRGDGAAACQLPAPAPPRPTTRWNATPSTAPSAVTRATPPPLLPDTGTRGSIHLLPRLRGRRCRG